MSAILLPDDADEADRVVVLMNTVAALRAALRRTVHERDYWRKRAMADDADYQDGRGDYEFHLRQGDAE